MGRRYLVGFALLIAAAAALWFLRPHEAAPPPGAETPAPAGATLVPPPTLKQLARGVNLSGWLQYGYENEPTRYAPDAADWKLIRALGLTHVRIPVDPAALLNDRGLPKAEPLAKLHAAVDGAVKAGLTTIITLQLPDEMKASLAGEPQRAAFAGTWRALVAALRDVPPAQLVLEPLNEPGFEDAKAARALMQFLAGELRAAAPHNTLLLSGHKFSGVEELGALAPLEDRNVVYGFHFYEPYDFTHQGADWGDPVWKQLRGFPYPSSPELVAPRLDKLHGVPRDRLHWHGEQRWDRGHLAARLGIAAKWGQDHGVPVMCSEFGVLRKRAAPAERAAWLRDVRETLEAQHIGWTAWDYSGAFGLVSGDAGARVVDPQTAAALGLHGP